MAEPATALVDVRGTPVRLMRAGSGEPLLLLRGTDASDDWRPWMDRLAERLEVIVPDHPGFGGRPLPPWLDSVRDLAAFHLDLVDALGLGRIHLAGTSLGGWIAADMALQASHRLASLTLIGAAGIRVPDAGGIDIFLRTEPQALADRFHDEAVAAREAQRLLRAETEDVRLADAIVVARVAWSPRLHDPHLQKWLHRITTPTLVVWGEEDRVLPVAYAHAWGRLIPGARVATIAGCGHWVAHERPDRLAGLIIEHARQSAGGGSAP